MQDNLAIWNAVKQPPASALRPIQGGRLRGKTDVNPQWRYLAMTEQFGICGIGWKYEVVRVWNETISTGETFAFAEIKLYVRHDGQWSEPIPGHGGSMLLEKESSGLHASDEGYKMAITDALSVAMKMLGIAADIYAGAWDGTKYSTEKKEAVSKPKETEHWCDEHNTAFFMRGKMKAFAHPIEGTDKWCHEHKEKEQPSEPESSPESTTTTIAAVKEESGGIAEDKTETSIPNNIQALYNWIAVHGKKYTRSWFLENFSYTEEGLKDSEQCVKAYHEVKDVSGWEK